MSIFSRRKAQVAALAATTVLAVAAPAAAVTQGEFGPFRADGVYFYDAGWKFSSWPCDRSCTDGRLPNFTYWGTLKDNASDGDWVYTRMEVDGYGLWGGSSAENHDGYPKTKRISQTRTFGDPPAKARVQACTHRWGVIPNDCHTSYWRYR